MSKSTVKVVEIDTNPAVKSIKDLRKELMEYKNQMANLEEGSDAFLEIANKAGEVKHQIDEINESVKGASADFGDVVSNITNVAGGISGAFEAVAGGLQAIGVESEALDKAIARMQGLHSVTQGLSAIDDGIKSLKKLQKSITATTGVAKVFKTVLQPKVLLAVTAAITALVAIWNKWGDSIKEALPFLGKTTKQLEAEKKAAEEAAEAKKKQAEAEESYRKKVGSAIQGTLSDYKLLQAQYRKLSTDYQKMRWIENNKEAFDKLGLSVKNLKDAEDKFVNNTDAVVKALIKRAIATAKQQQLTELASKYTEAKVKAEQEYEKKKVGAGSVVPGSSHKAGAYEYVDRNGRWVYTEEGANKANEKLQKQLNAEADLFYQQMNALAAEIADEMSIDKILQGINNGANGGTSGTATKIVDETKKKALDLVEFTDADLQSGLERVKKYWEGVYDIQLEQLKRSDKTDAEKLTKEISIEKQRLTLYTENTLEYEKQLTHIFNLENELKELTETSTEVVRKKTEEVRDMGNAIFENLKSTVDMFADSSLGISSGWIESLNQFQTVFTMTMDTVEKKGKATWQDYGNIATTALSGIGTVLNTLSQEQDASTEEGFKKTKQFQIAATILNMLSGIMNAWTSAMSPSNAWMTVAGQIAMGTAMSGMIAGIGAAQIEKIKNATMSSANPNTNINAKSVNSMIMPPVQYSNAVQGANTEGAITNQRVYVLESDISKTTKAVVTQMEENTY